MSEQPREEMETGIMLSTVDIDIKPLKKHGKELACAVTGSSVNGGIIELRSGSSHTLKFQLVPGNVPGVKFLQETDDPFCSATDDCPKKGDQINQFPRVDVSSDQQTLTVTANPGTDPIVHYALRFTDDGTNTLTWDPIIINT